MVALLLLAYGSDVFVVFVTLERPQSDVVELKEICMVAIDCSVISEPFMCIEYRDNSSMSRWLSLLEENS